MTEASCVATIAILAILVASPGAYAQAPDETGTATANVTARTSVDWLTPPSGAVRGAMKTSDFGALPTGCRATPENGGNCAATDDHQSTPKNIGHILCLPVGVSEFVVEESCLRLLFDGQNQCQRNAIHGGIQPSNCDEQHLVVMPYCNYRTEKTGNVEWAWTVAGSDDGLVIGCSQRGYRGFTPKDLGAGEESTSIMTGCLRYGRLRSLAAGGEPLRPCSPRETQITMPAAIPG